MDSIDYQILKILRKNARTSYSTISREVHLSIPAIRERIQRLERNGVIQHYTITLSAEKFGRTMTCFILIKLSNHSKESDVAFQEYVKSSEQIVECYRVTGNHEYMLKLVVRSAADIETFIDEIKTALNVVNTSTLITLKTVKEPYTAELPADGS